MSHKQTWYFNFAGELLSGVTVAGVMFLLGWWRGDSVPLWATFLGFVIGDLLWWKQRDRTDRRGPMKNDPASTTGEVK